jgi:hypothetical protein
MRIMGSIFPLFLAELHMRRDFRACGWGAFSVWKAVDEGFQAMLWVTVGRKFLPCSAL